MGPLYGIQAPMWVESKHPSGDASKRLLRYQFGVRINSESILEGRTEFT
jgi:hypothetical protein